MMSLNDALRPSGSFAWFAGYDSRPTASIAPIGQDAVTTAQIPAQHAAPAKPGNKPDGRMTDIMYTLELLKFFANAGIIASGAGMLLNIAFTQQVLTFANAWFAVAAIIAAVTRLSGGRTATSYKAAQYIRNSMILGLSLSMLAFAAASGLVAIRLMFWLFSL